jgi:hypothetical protein
MQGHRRKYGLLICLIFSACVPADAPKKMDTLTQCPTKAEAEEFIVLGKNIVANWNESHLHRFRMYEIWDTKSLHEAINYMEPDTLSKIIQEMEKCIK